MLVDTHCHLNMLAKEQFNTMLSHDELKNIEHIVQEAEQADVQCIITIGTSLSESINSILIAEKFPGVFAAIGLHPNDATSAWHDEFNDIKKLLAKKKIVAIGECGLDFHWPDYNKQLQKDVFKAHIELALEHNLALIIHSRDAYDETMRTLEPYRQSLSRVVFHCFSENLSAAQEIISYGFFLGISGIVTYPKNNELRTIISTVGLEHIVLETDAPFLPPQIIRGKKNQPKYIAAIAHAIAQHLQKPYQEIADSTTANAERLYALNKMRTSS